MVNESEVLRICPTVHTQNVSANYIKLIILDKVRIILTIFFICSAFVSNLLGQQIEIKKWKEELIYSINHEVVKQVEKSCLVDSTAWKHHFERELENYPIEKALNRITEISKKLSRGECIIFELFYPMVGFDPEEGYETTIYVKNRKRIKDVEIYDESLLEFRPHEGNYNHINKRIKYKSDCYGTGYHMITVFNRDLAIEKINIALSIEIKMK